MLNPLGRGGGSVFSDPVEGLVGEGVLLYISYRDNVAENIHSQGRSLEILWERGRGGIE